jgi:hypothetical protein
MDKKRSIKTGDFMNIFVGNLSFDATEEDVKKLFEGFGQVKGVVIVKEKNGKKSRGFGFVEMAERSQGEAAVSALNLKEFMGRPLNVSPERPKSELDDEPLKKKKLPEKIDAAPEEYHGQKDFGKDKWFSPVFRSAGGDKKRKSRRGYGRGDEQETRERPQSWRKSEERPRPWRKNADESKPAKRYGEHPKSWRKPEGAARPGRKPEAGARPWHKPEGGVKPWRKPEAGARPWRKPEAGARSWHKPEGGVKPWRKPEAGARPWRKPEGGARPWRKPEEGAKPWRKSEGTAKPWRKPRESVDSARRSRQKTSAYKR